MCKCKECEMLNEEPVRVNDQLIGIDNHLFHFENGYKCLWNGNSSLDMRDLQSYGCRLDVG